MNERTANGTEVANPVQRNPQTDNMRTFAYTDFNAEMPTKPASLAENEHVKELLGILKDNGKDAAGLTALLNHVKGVEDFVKQAENKIADMKSQLDEMKEIQNHPIRNALQNTVKALETKVAEIKEQLAELKANIIDGCKSAVAAFKEKGISILDKLASFFKVKSCLEEIKNGSIAAANQCDKSIARIEAFSKQYHAAGSALKNMARIAVGKEPIDAAKESGKLAEAMCAPARAEKACMVGIRKAATGMIGKLNQLEKKAEANREEKSANEPAAKAKKPSLMERLDEKKELVRQKDLDRALPARAMKPKGIEV